MIVDKYIPSGMYGFVTDGENRLFFHLAAFDPGAYEGDSPIPPVIGEAVEVEVEAGEGNKACRVCRVDLPTPILGVVDWFDTIKGYGFIRDEQGASFYLHRSEVLEGKLPLDGHRVSFYVGNDSQRACHVSVERSDG